MLPSPILTATSGNIGRWIDTAKSQMVGDADKTLIESGTPEGRKRFLIILFANSFLALNCSFHATLRDYYSRIIAKNMGLHEAAAVAAFLSYVQDYIPEMVQLDFVDTDLAEQSVHPSVSEFLKRFG
ncbi:MAG TPA: hypothetical protein VK985_08740 [Rariglobus sp.]|nr:hypothetical protein [Rariglobus sp.]